MTNTGKTYDVAVIGGGVIGTSCAYHLVKKGLSVALIERYDIARGTSSHCDAAALIVDKQPGEDALFAQWEQYRAGYESMMIDLSA